MRLLLAPALAALAAPVLADSHIGVADIEVTAPGDAALVIALDGTVSAATESIGACRAEGGALETCVCANPEALASVRAALDALLARHPEWEDKALFVADNGEGQSLTIWLDTVARAFAPPDCG